MFEIYAHNYRPIDDIPLGYQGENLARCFIVDITDAVNEFGNSGEVDVRNQRPGDTRPYYATNVTTVTGADADGGVHTYIKWALTSADTTRAGKGFAQADYIINDVIAKSWVFRYEIAESLGVADDMPAPDEPEEPIE